MSPSKQILNRTLVWGISSTIRMVAIVFDLLSVYSIFYSGIGWPGP